LKNSLFGNPQKSDRVRKLYERFSHLAQTFSITRILAFLKKGEFFNSHRIYRHLSMPEQRLAGNPCLDVLSHCDFDWFLLSRLPIYFCVTRNAIRLFRARPSSVELSATG
jgi:hypothetical protein